MPSPGFFPRRALLLKSVPSHSSTAVAISLPSPHGRASPSRRSSARPAAGDEPLVPSPCVPSLSAARTRPLTSLHFSSMAAAPSSAPCSSKPVSAESAVSSRLARSSSLHSPLSLLAPSNRVPPTRLAVVGFSGAPHLCRELAGFFQPRSAASLLSLCRSLHGQARADLPQARPCALCSSYGARVAAFLLSFMAAALRASLWYFFPARVWCRSFLCTMVAAPGVACSARSARSLLRARWRCPCFHGRGYPLVPHRRAILHLARLCFLAPSGAPGRCAVVALTSLSSRSRGLW